ncbi:ras GTPase-activating protein 4 [Chiloscyllium plagiosum]|uniref:ras GTPase-activating protein 4 n=1 Tax=Chiloscyllium plagiosum TaxID=36176 RepID=UPI001CB87B4E|nr:ras GTPase-activating protein 4 [Chiloscyllium plagiosum]
MAKRSSLFLRIVEGKNLPAKDLTGSSDPYCIVRIDNETIIRTATIWKTLSPFWGEEYNVHLPSTFHSISFYVMDEDAISRDDVIGKVAIAKDILTANPKGVDSWMCLSEIDPDEEVQGEIHLRIEVCGESSMRKLRCHVFEARDLARKDLNGASDPFVRVQYNGKTQESSVVKKSCYPRWNEVFEFVLDDTGAENTLHVEVWDWDLVSKNDFLGKVGTTLVNTWLTASYFSTVTFQIINQTETVRKFFAASDARFQPELPQKYEAMLPFGQFFCSECWVRTNKAATLTATVTQSDSNGRPGSCINATPHPFPHPGSASIQFIEENLGSLRLQLRLRDESVLPSSYYQPLMELLLQSVKATNNGEKGNLLALIDEVTTAENRQEVATNLVKLFLGQGLAKEFLDFVMNLELDRTTEPNTLFRNNSLASKSMECFLKVAGMQYLHNILGPTISRVFEERKYVELDPNKVEFREAGCSGLHRCHTEADIIQQSAQCLQSYLTELIEAIVNSVEQCPSLIRATFKQLFSSVEERFPQDLYRNIKYIAVTSFLCLRFFSPAIMSPKLFYLRPKHADARTSRTLLLLAKAIQSIGNMDTNLAREKEIWMAPLQPLILQGVTLFKDFIVKLIDFEEEEELESQKRVTLQTTSTIKEGYLLMHRAKERGILTSSHFKKHYFCLNYEALCHSKMSNAKTSACIPLSKIRAIEKVDEKCFGSAYVMQIISTDGRGQFEIMYLQCKNVNELNQWLSSLRKHCVSNEQMLNSYHPGVFKGERWSCCHQKEKAAPGCDKTHFGVTLQEWNDPLNPDLESHLIYRQLLSTRDLLMEKYLEYKVKNNVTGPGSTDEGMSHRKHIVYVC